MITKARVVLDGVSLDQISDSIVIVDISEKPPSLKISTSDSYAPSGQFILNTRRQSLSVSVEFEIRQRQPDLRQAILNEIRKWCNGTWLEISNRPGQRIKTLCTSYPSANSLMHFMEHLTMTFDAYESPFWEDSFSITCSSGNTIIRGTAPAVLNCKATITSPVTTITFQAGDGCFVSFDNLTTVAGDEIKIGHDESGRMTATLIHSNGTSESIYNHLTVNSYDDLIADPGPIALSATVPSASWSYRARWC